MSIVFKPRRVKRSTGKTGSKKSLVLTAGELLVVKNDTSGSTGRYDLYIGDGSTTLETLKPSIYGDTSEEDITITADSSTDSSTALGNVVTGKSLGSIIGSLKQAITKLSSEKANSSHTHAYVSTATMSGTKITFTRGDSSTFSVSGPIFSVVVSTAAATAAKVGSSNYYYLANKSYCIVYITASNTAQSALTLNINSRGAKPIYINGTASSSSNYTLPAGTYLVYYNGTNYYFRTDGKITGDITGTAATASAVSWSNVQSKPSTFTPGTHTHTELGNVDFKSSGNIILKFCNAGTSDSVKRIIAAKLSTTNEETLRLRSPELLEFQGSEIHFLNTNTEIITPPIYLSKNVADPTKYFRINASTADSIDFQNTWGSGALKYNGNEIAANNTASTFSSVTLRSTSGPARLMFCPNNSSSTVGYVSAATNGAIGIGGPNELSLRGSGIKLTNADGNTQSPPLYYFKNSYYTISTELIHNKRSDGQGNWMVNFNHTSSEANDYGAVSINGNRVLTENSPTLGDILYMKHASNNVKIDFYAKGSTVSTGQLVSSPTKVTLRSGYASDSISTNLPIMLETTELDVSGSGIFLYSGYPASSTNTTAMLEKVSGELELCAPNGLYYCPTRKYDPNNSSYNTKYKVLTEATDIDVSQVKVTSAAAAYVKFANHGSTADYEGYIGCSRNNIPENESSMESTLAMKAPGIMSMSNSISLYNTSSGSTTQSFAPDIYLYRDKTNNSYFKIHTDSNGVVNIQNNMSTTTYPNAALKYNGYTVLTASSTYKTADFGSILVSGISSTATTAGIGFHPGKPYNQAEYLCSVDTTKQIGSTATTKGYITLAGPGGVILEGQNIYHHPDSTSNTFKKIMTAANFSLSGTTLTITTT